MDLKIPRQLREEYYKIKKEPEELFHDSWFFGNVLQRSNNNNKAETARSYQSEPCTSSSDEVLTGKSYEETYESIKKLLGRDGDESTRPVLVKAPSMPCSMEIRKDQDLLTRGRSGLRRSKLSNKKILSSNLVRVPSLPVSLKDHEDFEDDEELEFSMGRLIRLASMSSSDSYLPPRTAHAAAKGAKPELESIKSEDITSQQHSMKQLQPQKCSSASNSKELQGFKKSQLDINKTNMNPGTSAPTLVGEKKVRRWNSKEHSSAPPVPTIWGGKKSSNDTKEQIKFWARSVASNVRQEC